MRKIRCGAKRRESQIARQYPTKKRMASLGQNCLEKKT